MASEDSQSECDSWWASVRYSPCYPEGQRYEDVSVSKIQFEKKKNNKLKRKPFKPTDFNDFKGNEWYIVFTSSGVSSGEEKPFWAQIGRMRATTQDLVAEKETRIRWICIPAKQEEPDTSVEGSTSEAPNDSIGQKKFERLAGKKRRREADNHRFEFFMRAEGIDPPVNPDGDGDDSADSNDVEALKAKIRILERQAQANANSSFSSLEESLKSSLGGVCSDLKQQMDRLSQSFEDMKRKYEHDMTDFKAEVKSDLQGIRKSPSHSASFVQEWVNKLPSKQ